jgi:transposase
VTQEELFSVVPVEKLSVLSREELEEFLRLEQDFRKQLEKEVQRLRALNNELEQKRLLLGEQYVVLKNKLFGKSSERAPSEESVAEHEKTQRAKKKRVMLPSLRYPDAPLIERHVELENLPSCACCKADMKDSGMTEDSEFLTVIPAQFYVVRQKRHKYRCEKCHGDIQTAPAPERIKQGSSYSDELIVDVACAKYCDLIPVERYASIAGRAGLEDLPPHSLIESTHNLADFLESTYKKLEQEIRENKILHADETPHRMLEGDKKSNWYLWGFSSPVTSYFEIHSTRSGDVASNILGESKCEYLMSDVFSGYGKAVKDSNVKRSEKKLPLIFNIYCNAHARRKFKESEDSFAEESKFFIEQYQEIYKLEADVKQKPPDKSAEIRLKMQPFFEAMRDRAYLNMNQYSSQSSVFKAMSYFLKNYNGLTLFCSCAELPIDNNPQERLLRSPVIGRKTWYGTHSKRGAKTAAILFSIVESCKLNKINPREYLKKLINDIKAGKPCYTPRQFQPQ